MSFGPVPQTPRNRSGFARSGVARSAGGTLWVTQEADNNTLTSTASGAGLKPERRSDFFRKKLSRDRERFAISCCQRVFTEHPPILQRRNVTASVGC